MAKKPPRGELPPDWFCEGQTVIEDFLDPTAPCDHPRRYFCRQSGEDECPDCGGFDICCETNDHTPIPTVERGP